MWINIDDDLLQRVMCALDSEDAEAAAQLREQIELFSRGELEEAYYEAAGGPDGELEVDSSAVVSLSDDPGAYVMAWQWVSNESLPDDVRKKFGLNDEDEGD